MLEIFEQDAFRTIRMVEALREMPYVPGRIGSLGLFSEQRIDTLDIAIEKKDAETLLLVPSSPRGGPGGTRDMPKRSLRKLTVPHFERADAIYADEIQQVRRFGDEEAVERLQEKIMEKAAVHSQDFALTEEFHRLTLIKTGTVLDANNSDVLVDFLAEMGESLPAEIDFDLDNASPAEGALRKRCAAVDRAMAATLGGLPYTGLHAFCGDAFFDDLIAHPEVRETYKGYADAASLRSAFVSGDQSRTSGSFGTFQFGGITWENYRGSGVTSVHTDKCHIIPLGVPNLFRTVYAPADYLETVNRPGQRLYAKQWRMQNDKGVNLEFQTNVLHYCTRPRVLMRGRRT